MTAETLLTAHQMQDMLIECRSSVKFDLNQMEMLAIKPAASKTTQAIADSEANRLRLLLDRIDAIADCVRDAL